MPRSFRTGFKWVDSKGREWVVVENLYFGRYLVRTVDGSRVGELSGNSIRAEIAAVANAEVA